MRRVSGLLYAVLAAALVWVAAAPASAQVTYHYVTPTADYIRSGWQVFYSPDASSATNNTSETFTDGKYIQMTGYGLCGYVLLTPSIDQAGSYKRVQLRPVIKKAGGGTACMSFEFRDWNGQQRYDIENRDSSLMWPSWGVCPGPTYEFNPDPESMNPTTPGTWDLNNTLLHDGTHSLVATGHLSGPPGAVASVDSIKLRAWNPTGPPTPPPANFHLLIPAAQAAEKQWFPSMRDHVYRVNSADGLFVWTNSRQWVTDGYLASIDTSGVRYHHFQLQVRARVDNGTNGQIRASYWDWNGNIKMDLAGSVTATVFDDAASPSPWLRGPVVHLDDMGSGMGWDPSERDIYLILDGIVTYGRGSLYVDTVRLKMW